MTKKATSPGQSSPRGEEDAPQHIAESSSHPAAKNAAEAPAPADGSSSASGLAEKIQTLEADLREAQGRALRLQADMENYRKRSRRELEDATRFATLPLLRDLLPVIDNLQRAIATEEAGASHAGLVDGIRMVAQQLAAVLENHHCRPIDADGQSFDPTRHEAIAQQPSRDADPGTILEVVQAGYRLHDRVIRPSQVVVARQPDDS